MRSGDVWAQGDGTISPLKNRSEIAEATHYALGTDLHVKYGWTIEPGAASTASWLTTAQFRQVANDPYSAPFGIMMNGEKMRISLAEGGTSGSNYHDVYVDSQNMVRGHEYQMQIDVRFDPVHGHLDVIRDGVTLVNYDGPVGWSDLGGVYWKEGVYRADSPEAMAMDYSHLSITTGAQTTTTTPTTPTSAAGTVQTTPLTGTASADVLTGQADVANRIRGLDGDDQITGGSAFNDINGNTGNDTIIGKSTVGDWLLGGQGNDSINASASTAHNIVNGNLGADTLTGGSGGDTLRGGQGDDVIHGGSGQDWISGDLGVNTIYGGQGMDTFHAGQGHDSVTGWHAGDRVLMDSGVTYTSSQVGGDVHIAFSNGGQMDLLNTQVSSLQPGWII